MKRSCQAIVAVLVALCVLGIFVSPLVAVPLTTLRNHHGPSALAGSAPASAVLAISQPAGTSALPDHRPASRPSGAALIDLTCVRLC